MIIDKSINIEHIKEQQHLQIFEDNFESIFANIFYRLCRELDDYLCNIDPDLYLSDVFKDATFHYEIESKKDYKNFVSHTNSVFSCKILDTIEDKDHLLQTHIKNMFESKQYSAPLEKFLVFTSYLTKNNYKKSYDINMMNYLDICKDYDKLFNIKNNIDEHYNTIINNDMASFINGYLDNFIFKIYSTLIDKYGQDLHIDFKRGMVKKQEGQNVSIHPLSNNIKKDPLYLLINDIYSSNLDFCITPVCYKPVLEHFEKKERNKAVKHDMHTFKISVEREALNKLLNDGLENRVKIKNRL